MQWEERTACFLENFHGCRWLNQLFGAENASVLDEIQLKDFWSLSEPPKLHWMDKEGVTFDVSYDNKVSSG